MIALYVLYICILGQVCGKHFIVQTGDTVENKKDNVRNEEADSMDKEADDAAKNILEILNEENMKAFDKLPKKDKKTMLKEIEKFIGADYALDGIVDIIKKIAE